MTVTYWQLFVISSVLGAYLFKGEKPARWVTIGWTLWTVVIVLHLPLAAIQLASAWGTYAVCHQFAAQRRCKKEQERENRELKDKIKEVLDELDISRAPREAVLAAARSPQTELHIIAGREHYETLKRAFRDARASVCLFSGWIGTPLVNTTIRSLICGALARGVDVYIGFGSESPSGDHSPLPASIDALAFLRAMQRARAHAERGRLMVGKFPNHEKLLVVDGEYLVIGSNNWLSNAAFHNSERSIKVTSRALATQERVRIERLVRQSASINTLDAA